MSQNQVGEDAVVTAVFPDDNRKYLSTGNLVPEVELRSYEAFKRACYT
jgi:hypothetical protein